MGRANRRREARAEAEFEVQYATSKGFVTASTRNTSRGGIYIQTQQPLELAQKALLRFTLPGTTHWFEVRGKVAWINFPTKRNPFPAGMGMKFLDLNPKARTLISNFVKKAHVPSPPAGQKT